MIALMLLMALGGCSQPKTDSELTSQAQLAVDQALSSQARFSLMESRVSKHIACGHAAFDRGQERDFVYRDGVLILDDDPAFNEAAAQCDAAIAGRNVTVNGSSWS